MEYTGKLYGKIGGEYFDTGKTTDDWDELEEKANPQNKTVIRHMLKKVKENPELLNELDRVRIFSNEHNAYWRGSSGYTTQRSEAKIWDAEVAYDMTKHCGPEKGIEFINTNQKG